jgi:hypothetical protein
MFKHLSSSLAALSFLASAGGGHADADVEVEDLGGALATLQSAGPSAPPTMGKVVLRGTGCSNADLATPQPVIVPNGQVFLFKFDNFQISVNPRTTEYIKELDCTIEAEIRAPAGIQYTLTSFTTSGHVYLDEGVQAEAAVSYFLDGMPRSVQTTNPVAPVLRGPMTNNALRITDYVDTTDMVWSQCNAQHAIQVRMRLKLINTEPRRTGNIAFNYTDTHVSAVEVGMAHRRCVPTL